MPKVLLVDDEAKFRSALAERLRMRGYDPVEVENGDDAIKAIRADRDIEVVLLDRMMPGKSGEQTLVEIKGFRPEVQVIMLTAFGSVSSATEVGKLDAFGYHEKPVEDLDALITTLEAALEEVTHAQARHEVAPREKSSIWRWLLGMHNSRPIFIFLGLFLFTLLTCMPIPERLLELVSVPKTVHTEGKSEVDAIFGYSSYRNMKPGETISDFYSHKYDIRINGGDDSAKKVFAGPRETARRAQVMLAVIVIAALFWATGAVPVGVTALIVGVAMYFFGVLKPDAIAQAYAKDAVVFIFGVLALSKAITKTGFDRRIGLLLLAPAKNLPLLLLVFLPLFSVTCSFVSEHALIAFTLPLFVMVYVSAIRHTGIRKDRALMVMFALSLCFAANVGGPGSPAAGGRNAIMIGILADYGMAPSFTEWVKYGLPMVPVLSFCIGLYFFLRFRGKISVKKLDVSRQIRAASKKIGKMNRDEYFTGATLIGVILLWVLASDTLGMGGPVILGLVVLNMLRVLKWRDMASIHWEVVFLYAGASAIGKGLAVTGGALYLADSFIGLLPESMLQGEGLAIAASLFTGLATNFMSDGATVSAIGPITVPMAFLANVHPWMVGYATAFASSFAHMLIIGTPSNALAFAMAKDPVTGEQLVTLTDFAKHGFVILLISFAVLWGWVIFGYWRWIGFPGM